MDTVNMDTVKPYKDILATAMSFDGMMSDLSVALFDCLLRRQAAEGVRGNLIEFGVYRGRSASILLEHLDEGEELGLVDVADYPEFGKLAAISTRYRFFKGKSEDLAGDAGLNSFLEPRVRFSHHDASHSFNNVMVELGLIESRLRDGGVAVLDDFNWHYSQVIAAFFRHKYCNGSNLELFLLAENKAYLCHKEDFRRYGGYVVSGLLDDLRDRGFDCYAARTEDRPEHRPFHIARKKKKDQPALYGVNTYGDRYYRVA